MRQYEHALFVEITRLRRTQHTSQKLSFRQWGDYEPPRLSTSPTAPDTRQTMAAKDCIRYVISVDVPLGQMFEAGGGEDQRPAEQLHTIMVCAPSTARNRSHCESGLGSKSRAILRIAAHTL
jgi:hypothetical protein